MNSVITKIQRLDEGERYWLKTLNNPFSSMHLAVPTVQPIPGYKRDILMLDQKHCDGAYNPNGSMKFYLANVITTDGKTYYEAVAVPTGLIILDQGMQTINCVDGFLHDASGSPAMTSTLFGDAYYLHGIHYKPVEYFRYLEKERGQYIEYQPQKYIQYMASVLGGKT